MINEKECQMAEANQGYRPVFNRVGSNHSGGILRGCRPPLPVDDICRNDGVASLFEKRRKDQREIVQVDSSKGRRMRCLKEFYQKYPTSTYFLIYISVVVTILLLEVKCYG